VTPAYRGPDRRGRGAVLTARAAAAFLIAASLGCSRDAGERAPPPSIVLLTVDTLRADRLGAYGHPGARTPVIDALARRGVRFDAAMTPFPRTTPALASLLTGRLPWHHGSREVGQPMRAIATVPSILLARGYGTLGVSVNGAAGPAQNLHLGFERFLDYQSFADHTAAGVTDATIALLDEVLAPTPASDGAGTVATRRTAAVAPARTAEAPAAAGLERPIFLWVHYIDPHFPYAPPADWQDQPPAPACRDLVARTGDDLAATAHVGIDLGGEASAALADCAALYDAEIAFTDFHVGRLLEALEQRGLLAQAHVVFTSDHGENLGEDGLFYEHGPSVHDASLRVPLLVAGPGIPPGVDAGVARLEDLAPTLLALAGVPVGDWPPFDGVDLSPRLFDEEAGGGGRKGEGGGRDGAALGPRAGRGSAPAAVAESGGALFPEAFTHLASGRPGALQCINGERFSLCAEPRGEPRLYDHVADPFLERDLSAEFPEVREGLLAIRRRWPPGLARQRALRTERFKLVERPRPEGGWTAALYDLAEDPGETKDLSAERPDLVAGMRRELEAAFAGSEAPAAAELTPKEVETLRALGYLR